MASTKAAMQSTIEDLRSKLDYAEQRIAALEDDNQRLAIKLCQQTARGNAKAEVQPPKYFKPTPALLALAAKTYPGCNSFTKEQLLALQ